MEQLRLTQRDLALICEVLRWGGLPLHQLASWYFDAERTAANRVTRLRQAGLLRSVREGPHVIVTTTRAGARLRPDLELPWRARPWQSIEHLLATIHVAARLLADDQDSGWTTERELLNDQLKQARQVGGRLRAGLGRRPDGVLVQGTGEWIAIEVELHRKSRIVYERIMACYLAHLPGMYRGVRWYVRGGALASRVAAAVNQYALSDVVSVQHLPGNQMSDKVRGLQGLTCR